MKAWAWMLGGLLVWGAHFLGVYVIASIADVVATADDFGWRMGGLAFSVACVLITAVLLALALKRLAKAGEGDGMARFPDQLAALGAGVALIAIVWQALPTLIGY